MELLNVYPINQLTITRGQGSYVWDSKGEKYLDFYGGHAVISIGHSHPHYISAVEKQLKQIGFYSNSIHIPQQQELATLLGSISGKEDYQLFLCNSGAEANENAIKLASFHTGRKKVIAFTGAFHGRTSLAVAATDNKKLSAPVNDTDKIICLPFNDVSALHQCFEHQGNEIAAVITEGIQGVGGIQAATTDFLKAIRTLCDQHGSVYIADAVQCGYGRSGQFFSHDLAGVSADIYSVAKGMGNGFPIGAILIAPHIQAVHGMLGTTFGGNHLACAAAIAVLEVIHQESLLNHVQETGDYLIQELQLIPELQNIRGRGLMIGFNLDDAYKSLRHNLLFKHKIFTGEAKGNTIRLLPALNVSREDIQTLISCIKEEINHLNQ